MGCARDARGRGVVCLVAFGDVLIFHVIVRTHFSLDINCVSSPLALQRNLHVREEAWQEYASEGEATLSCSCLFFFFRLFPISVLIFILHVAARIKENDFVA